ncbi:hypothetical protein BHE74_00044706 [Ensete ventricosum]|nr:hypothetical protein BHE74_00044706 [Ensete ventricosum]
MDVLGRTRPLRHSSTTGERYAHRQHGRWRASRNCARPLGLQAVSPTSVIAHKCPPLLVATLAYDPGRSRSPLQVVELGWSPLDSSTMDV